MIRLIASDRLYISHNSFSPLYHPHTVAKVRFLQCLKIIKKSHFQLNFFSLEINVARFVYNAVNSDFYFFFFAYFAEVCKAHRWSRSISNVKS